MGIKEEEIQDVFKMFNKNNYNKLLLKKEISDKKKMHEDKNFMSAFSNRYYNEKERFSI